MATNRLLCALGLVLAVCAEVPRDGCLSPPLVNQEKLVTCLREVFSVTRGPSDVANKKTIRRFIVEYFNNISADVDKAIIKEQRFQVPDQSPSEGVNIIYVLPGAQWGSSNDHVLVVAANYDTVDSVTPGVDDNGSGMAALLETARIMSSRGVNCTSDTTVIFVAVDQLPGEIGLASFGTEYLIGEVLRKYAIPPDHFPGVLILKGLMNFDPTEQSQEIPPSVYLLAPEPANAIAARGNRGDFLTAVSLSPQDAGVVAQSYQRHWAKVTATMTSSRRPLFYDFELSLTMKLIDVFEEHIKEFTHAGVLPFWRSLDNYTADNFNIVVLTDTVQMRGYMRTCHRHWCDNLEMALKPNNIELLRVTTTTLVHYLVDASWSSNHSTDSSSSSGHSTGAPYVTEAPTTVGSSAAATLTAGNPVVLCVMLAAWLLT